MVRVRFAPSPTGYLHIGGLRTALYNELFALKNGGQFILRVEDTDQTRYVEGAVESLLRTLAWAGVNPIEGPYLDTDGTIKERGAHGPYVQSARTKIYVEHVEKLVQSGHAYRCFCAAETLDAMRQAQAASGRPVMYDRRCRGLDAAESARRATAGERCVVRLKVPESGQTKFDDAIRGTVVFENNLIDDQVLLKSDGFPTYHLANVVDDHLMEITHVIRAEEWLPSTPKHLMLYAAFDWTPPTFAHVPLLLNPDRSKLSKRQGDVAVEDYRDKGYLPEAIVNFIALCGWNPSADREIYSKDELMAAFDLGSVNKAGAVFNREKLDWFNREYLKRLSPEEIEELIRPYLSAAHVELDETTRRALALERSRVDRLNQLVDITASYRHLGEYDGTMLVWKKSSAEIAKARLLAARECLTAADESDWSSPAALETRIITFIKENGWTNGEALWPMRVALTGLEKSPSPFEVAWALGKTETLTRLERAEKTLS